MNVLLNHRVTVLKRQDGVDSVGQPLTEWVEYGKRWANVRVLSGIETLKAGTEASVVKASIRMQFCSDIDASMRIAYGGVTYDIKAPLPDASKRHIDFACESVK